MYPNIRKTRLPLVVACLLSSLDARSAETTAPARGVTDFVPLPEVVVEQKRGGPRALYGEVPGIQVLSLNSEKETREFVREVQRQRFLWGLIVPEEVQSKHSVPMLLVLSPQLPGKAAPSSQEMLTALRAGARAVNLPPGVQRSSVTPAFDTGAWAYFLTGNVTHVAMRGTTRPCLAIDCLLQHHTPEWPIWLTSAVYGMAVTCEFTKNSIQIQGFRPSASTDSLAFPPFEDIFDNTVLSSSRLPGLPADLKAPARPVDPGVLAQKKRILPLFVHWAFAGDQARIQAFWAFAARLAAEPASEKTLQECFGLDYAALQAELRKLHRQLERMKEDRYGGYDEPLAVFKASKVPQFSDIELHPATRAELVRTKSAWERQLAGRPGMGGLSEGERVQCLDQAGRRLAYAYEAGERDPQFLAERALWACENADDAVARRCLEEAAEAKVVHPRIYAELAHRRYREVRAQPQEPDQRLSRAQVAQVLEPLMVARTQSPSQALVYTLLADLWSHSAARPSPEELAVLNEYVQLFPSNGTFSRNSACSTKIALLNAREGNFAQAVRVIEQVASSYVPGSVAAAGPEKWVQMFRSAQTEQRSLTAPEVQQIEAVFKMGRDGSDVMIPRRSPQGAPARSGPAGVTR